MTAFWHYILLLEIAHKIVNHEENISLRDTHTRNLFDKVRSAFEDQFGNEQGDFSERLLKLVEDIAMRYQKCPQVLQTAHVTELIYKHDIRKLYDALTDYLEVKDEVWVIVDNLDKGWPIKGATTEDILILKGLLSATRKMQREWEKRNIEFKSLVFIRNDIYDHLIKNTSDREKDTAITLDWDDSELFKQMILSRITNSTKMEGPFDEIWMKYFDPLITGEHSFGYIIDRTLMRPRDVLKFVQGAYEIAINRNHDKVSEEDIIQAEKTYSEDLLQNISFELADVFPGYPNITYEFIGCPQVLNYATVTTILTRAGIAPADVSIMLSVLIWFGFIGIVKNGTPKYSYEVHYALPKLSIDEKSIFVIHPAFRKALECVFV